MSGKYLLISKKLVENSSLFLLEFLNYGRCQLPVPIHWNSNENADKVCDQVSDAILDEYLAGDPNSRVACETLAKAGFVVVAGEVTSTANVDIASTVRRAILDIGYPA